MKRASTRALLLGVAGVAATVFGGDVGCSASKPTEIVPGALTQVRVPKDLAAIQIEVKANGVTKFCQGYEVSSAGIVLLPSTLGVIEGAPNTTVRVTVRGYDDATSPDVQGCGGLGVNDPGTADTPGPGPRVLRRATLTYVNQHTLFLPMQLSFACYDNSTCTDSQTCVAGQCVDDTVDPKTLVDYDPSLLDGTQVCFSPSQCFSPGATFDATPVDANNCVYAVPSAPGGSSSGSGQATPSINVRIAYAQNAWVKDPATNQYAVNDGAPFEAEILNQDPQEGYSIDPSTPNQFTLAPGLCNLVKAASIAPVKPPTSGTTVFPVVSNVQVAVGCSPKKLLLPFCAGEQNKNVNDNPAAVQCGVAVPLNASRSAVYVLVDDSVAMHGAFGPNGYATAMNLSFADPVFKKTYVAFDFLHHKDSECGSTTTYASPKVPFSLPSAAQPLIAPLLLSPQPPDSSPNFAHLDLQAALQANGGVYSALTSFVALAGGGAGAKNPINDPSVMVFVNRIPVDPATADAGASDAGGADPSTIGVDCPPPGASSVQAAIQAEVSAAASQGIHTYFVVLNDDKQAGPTTVAFYNQIAQSVSGDAGSSSTAGVTVVDATSADPPTVFKQFQGSIATAVTCVYDQPDGIDSSATLNVQVPGHTPGFNDGGTPAPIPIQPASGCNLANKSNPSVNGWGVDNGHIVICGGSCQLVQAAIGQATLAALQAAGALTDAGITFDGGAIDVPDVPVTATMTCQ